MAIEVVAELILYARIEPNITCCIAFRPSNTTSEFLDVESTRQVRDFPAPSPQFVPFPSSNMNRRDFAGMTVEQPDANGRVDRRLGNPRTVFLVSYIFGRDHDHSPWRNVFA